MVGAFGSTATGSFSAFGGFGAFATFGAFGSLGSFGFLDFKNDSRLRFGAASLAASAG